MLLIANCQCNTQVIYLSRLPSVLVSDSIIYLYKNILNHQNFSILRASSTNTPGTNTQSISSVQPSVVNLSPLEFTKLSQPPLLIDVRSQLEYATGHAPGALNLSLPRILMGRFLGLRNFFTPMV